jgi:hypothetical protein
MLKEQESIHNLLVKNIDEKCQEIDNLKKDLEKSTKVNLIQI